MPKQWRRANRHDFQATSVNAVVGRQWQGKNYGPASKSVFLTNASVAKPLQPVDGDDDRSLIEHCGIKEATKQGDLGHPPA